MKVFAAAVVLSACAIAVLAVSLDDHVYRLNKPGLSRPQADIYTNCTAAGGILHLTATPKISPDPPQIGKDVHVVVKFNTTQEISDGEVNIDLKLDQEPLQLTVGLCEALQQIGESCPIKQGPGTFNVTTTIPDTTPGMLTGKATITTTVNDKDVEVLCVELHFKLE